MSWNVWNRPSESLMVDMGISSNIMESPSPKCYMTLRSAGQPQIGPHFIWNRDEWRWARFAIHILDSKDAQNPYKHRLIAGSSKCSTKPLSILITKLLTHIKQGLQKYCETAYSRSGINQMWILKNSKELLEHLKSSAFNHVTSIKSFDFSTLYTTIPHQKLKKKTHPYHPKRLHCQKR